MDLKNVEKAVKLMEALESMGAKEAVEAVICQPLLVLLALFSDRNTNSIIHYKRNSPEIVRT